MDAGVAQLAEQLFCKQVVCLWERSLPRPDQASGAAALETSWTCPTLSWTSDHRTHRTGGSPSVVTHSGL